MILHVIDSLQAGGAERELVELVNGLHARGVSVGVCITRHDRELARDLSDGVKLLVLERSRRWEAGALLRMAAECRRHGVRVLHAHSRSSVQLCGVVKVLLGGRVRIVFHDHYGGIHFDRSASRGLRIVARHVTDHYLAVSPALRDWARDVLGLPANRCDMLPNAIDARRFQSAVPVERASLGAIEQPVLGVLVANFRPQKDHELLLRTLASSDALRRSLHVLMLGGGLDTAYGRACRGRCTALRIERNVTFLGSRSDIPEILRTVDLGLLPSRSEGGPIAILEYMAAGLPFVATRTGFNTETAAESGVPGIVPLNDAEAFRTELEALVLASRGERHRRGLLGHQVLMDRFDIHRRLDVLCETYDRLRDGPVLTGEATRVSQPSSSTA